MLRYEESVPRETASAFQTELAQRRSCGGPAPSFLYLPLYVWWHSHLIPKLKASEGGVVGKVAASGLCLPFWGPEGRRVQAGQGSGSDPRMPGGGSRTAPDHLLRCTFQHWYREEDA